MIAFGRGHASHSKRFSQTFPEILRLAPNFQHFLCLPNIVIGALLMFFFL